ncbi:hypothetical protein DPMN_007493 [Dreissena polymorpha]|uniref:Uncharacterized protein n=1 Tax=Dreissena polymorpha TaxID=45954 RepID=A0A9D4MXG2_DREPO|nr:hypothetical protein DPMN_007493 [Dreissena polymorpha]
MLSCIVIKLIKCHKEGRVENIIWTNLLTKFHEDHTVNVDSRENCPAPWKPCFLSKHNYYLTKFHEDWTINVASRVLTRKNAPPPGGHVFKATKTIYELIQDIIGTNLLTKFHEDQTVNVDSRPYKENCPAPWKPCFSSKHNYFLTKFHEDWTINVASRVFTRKNAPPPGGHVFKATKTIFKLIQDIIGTNLLTNFHDDRKINVTSRVLTRKNAPPLWWPYNIGSNLLTEFHEDRTINVASSVKNVPPLGSHVYWTINEASKVLTRKNAPPPGGHVFNQPASFSNWKNAPPLGSHVFQAKTNLLSKFHEDQKINVASRVLKRKNAPPPGGNVLQPTSIIFKHIQDIIGMNLLTKFHEDLTINVASRVKNAPPLGSHVFQANVIIFELIQDIIETNLLTKFHEDWTIICPLENMAPDGRTDRQTTPKQYPSDYGGG